VTATILSAEVVRGGSNRTFVTGRSRSGYLPAVSFRYSVDGLDRIGDQERRTGVVESMRAARLRIEGLSPGKPVTAWYNPWQPADSVLDRTPNPIGLTLFVAVALLGAAMLAVGTPSAGRREASGASQDPESLRKSA
jgi:hypothetical protein